MIVYCITNLLNGKQYVGQTIQKLNDRLHFHFSQAPKARKSILNSAIKKYGKENFRVSILKECSSIKDLNETEWYYIKMFNTISPNGYNLKDGGNRNFKFSKETKEKMRFAKLGKKQSPEQIENCRLAHLGKRINPIKAIHRETGKVLLFQYLKQAENFGFLRCGILTHLRGKYNHYKNYIWTYITKEEYENSLEGKVHE